MLSKPSIRALIEVIQGKINIKDIAQALKISPNRASEILARLEETGFIVKQRKGLKIHLSLSPTSFAQAFKTLIYTMPAIKFEDFLFGLKLRILSYALFSWKSSPHIAQQLHISLKSIQNNISLLQRRGLLTRKKRLVLFNKKAWPKLFDFLEAYRNFSALPGTLLWKFEKEQLFEVIKEEDIRGSLTGFSRYRDFGITLFEARRCCILPKKSLNKRDIFIHSLLQIDSPRLTGLAVLFFKKHPLKNLEELAMKYDCRERLEDIQNIIKGKEPGILPKISKEKLEEMVKLYGL